MVTSSTTPSIGGHRVGLVRWMPLLAVAGVVLMVDQVSKSFALARGEAFFNAGVAFGLLADHPLVASIVAIGGLGVVVALAFHSGTSPLTLVGLGLIIGGGLGNMLDRVPVGRRLGVVDWIAIPGYAPYFDLADVAIRFGVLVVLAGFTWERSAHPSAARRHRRREALSGRDGSITS